MVTRTRPDWDRYFLDIAKAVSARGDCTRSQVGAVLVDAERVVISTGYNGVSPGEFGCLSGACPRGAKTYEELPQSTPYRDGKTPCIATHAEENAARFARRTLVGSTCYITRDPCFSCKVTLFAKGVNVLVWENDKGVWREYRGYWI